MSDLDTGAVGIEPNLPSDAAHLDRARTASATTTLTDGTADALYRKISRRILPLILAGYIVAYVDRVNVGFAKLQFLQDLAFSDAVYGMGAALFFAGYLLFEVPSNLVLERIGARATMTRIMVLWGLVSVSMAFISTPTEYYVMRFLLGAAEAGFFPGIILYLSYWFPAHRRGRITTMFTMGASIAGIIGSPLSGWLMSLDGLHGLRGWQVLFIYEGLPAVVLGVLYFLLVDDRPESAKWLTDEQKKFIAESVSAQRGLYSASKRSRMSDMFRERKIYPLSLAYMATLAGTQAVALWTPTILRKFGIGMGRVGLLASVPFVVSAVAMYVLGHSSDRFMERRWHFAVPIAAAGASLVTLSLAQSSVGMTIALLSVAAAGAWTAIGVFWTIPPTQLSTGAMVGGIAFISSSGSIGGFFSPVVVGWSSSFAGNIYGGLAVLGAALVCSGAVILICTRK
jgi:MFS family permease